MPSNGNHQLSPIADLGDRYANFASDFAAEEARAEAAVNARPPLSFRTPAEIIGWQFDDSDIILENRIMALGQSLVFAAAAGIGKSRLLLQLAACIATGRDFLGMAVKNKGQPFLIFQTENSNRRLHFDLGKIKDWLGPDFGHFSALCRIHTLETDSDSLLNIESGESVELMQRAIAEHPGAVVVFDPLNAFTSGNLNQDQDMRAVITTLARLSREGNPNRVPLFLHHALTGAAGAARATGFDRSSFARNSKTLLAWTRAQINIAPANPDNNESLVVACGKNSNGKEFAPFGIVMDSETMIYAVDPEFDFDQWQEAVDGRKQKKNTFSAEKIAEKLKPLQPLTKAKLVTVLMDELGISKACAYNYIEAALDEKAIRWDESHVFFYSNH